jgi:hypothetical protein
VAPHRCVHKEEKKSLASAQAPHPGRVAEQMGDLEHALSAYENALRHNPTSVSGLTQVAGIARIKENYPKVSLSFSADSTFQLWLCLPPDAIFAYDVFFPT